MLFELGHSGASEALARTSFTPLHPDSFPGFSENRVGRFPAGEYWWTFLCDRFGFVLARGTIALSGANVARRVDLPVVSADDLGSLRIVTHVRARPQLVGEEYRISDAVGGEEILTMVAAYSGREQRFESTLEGVPSGIYEVRSAQLGESRFVTVTERADARVEFRAP